jgi:hypothetical protein
MHLHKTKHGPEEDLDIAHQQLVAAVAAGAVTLEDREATPEEAREALGDLILLAKIAEDQGIDDDAGMV